MLSRRGTHCSPSPSCALAALCETSRKPLMTFVTAWCASSVALTAIYFALARRKQMRPTTPEGLTRWNAPPARCLPCRPRAKPRNHLWNTYIGADVSFDGLPAAAPVYRVKVCGCCEWGRDPEPDEMVPVQAV